MRVTLEANADTCGNAECRVGAHPGPAPPAPSASPNRDNACSYTCSHPYSTAARTNEGSRRIHCPSHFRRTKSRVLLLPDAGSRTARTSIRLTSQP